MHIKLDMFYLKLYHLTRTAFENEINYLAKIDGILKSLKYLGKASIFVIPSLLTVV